MVTVEPAVGGEFEVFAREEDRGPRMLVLRVGQEGHDYSAGVMATAFADLGFDVDVGPVFQTPVETSRQATENDVHLSGVASQTTDHKTVRSAPDSEVTVEVAHEQGDCRQIGPSGGCAHSRAQPRYGVSGHR